MSKRWIQERGKDLYWRLAKQRGYRSRAAFKLLEANRKYRFIKRGSVVVDLGAAPGSWMQVSSEIVGPKGFVLGVDLLEIEPFGLPNVESIVGDIADPSIVDEIRRRIPGKADVVLCDASPSISGIWELDHARQIDLAESALRIARSILKPGASFFTKVFQGEMLADFLEKVKEHFETVRIIKPKASRRESAEIYVLGLGFKGS